MKIYTSCTRLQLIGIKAWCRWWWWWSLEKRNLLKMEGNYRYTSSQDEKMEYRSKGKYHRFIMSMFITIFCQIRRGLNVLTQKSTYSQDQRPWGPTFLDSLSLRKHGHEICCMFLYVIFLFFFYAIFAELGSFTSDTNFVKNVKHPKVSLLNVA